MKTKRSSERRKGRMFTESQARRALVRAAMTIAGRDGEGAAWAFLGSVESAMQQLTAKGLIQGGAR